MGSKLVTALLVVCGAACESQSSAPSVLDASAGAGSAGGAMSATLAGASSLGAGGGATASGGNNFAGQISADGNAGAGAGGRSSLAGAGGAPMGGNAGHAAASPGGASGNGAHAGGGVAGTSAALEPVKGLGFNLAGSSCEDLKTLGLSWFYTWSATSPCASTQHEFVPQIWGSWKKLSWELTPAKAVAKGAKYLLGFNEPDRSDQANLTTSEAIALWPDFDQPGVRIGSPAVAGQDNWLPDFMTQAESKKLRVDFIALHWYGWDSGSCNDTSALEGKLKWAEQWHRPIWITEWSCRLQSIDVDKKFLASALAMLKKHPSVERYAWFLSRSGGEFVNAALLDKNGNATGIGAEYIAAPATR